MHKYIIDLKNYLLYKMYNKQTDCLRLLLKKQESDMYTEFFIQKNDKIMSNL